MLFFLFFGNINLWISKSISKVLYLLLQTNEALKFSEEFLVKKVKGNSKGREQVEQTFSLLAFQDPSQSPYAKVLDASHRELVSFFVFSLDLKNELY